LEDDQGLTIAVAYKKGLMPLLTAKPPKTFVERLIEFPSIVAFIVVVLIGSGVIFYLWYQYGRDYWFAGVLFGTKDQKGKVKPLGGHETISVEFTSPESLRPAEIGILLDERADTLDVVATIIDLATRGYLTITEIPKKWLFGKVDYLLTTSTPKTRVKKTEPLEDYEQLLLDKLFYKRRQIKVSSLKTTFYSELHEVKQALYDDVVSKKLFPTNPEKVRNKYLAVGIVLVILGIGLCLLGNSKIILFAEIGLGEIVCGILFIFSCRFMPRKTAYGRELYRRAKGYYLFIDRAERYRQRYFEKENMFNEVLPYAIVFGLTKKFAKKMEKIGIKPETSWYVGTHTFATGAFVGNIDDFGRSMSTAMTQTPSHSGGFSGGSSGGGFGGGGGGSW